MEIKHLSDALTRHFDGDTDKVKKMATECKTIGFTMSEHLDHIEKNPEQLLLLVTYSDLGVLGKLAESINKLKGRP